MVCRRGCRKVNQVNTSRDNVIAGSAGRGVLLGWLWFTSRADPQPSCPWHAASLDASKSLSLRNDAVGSLGAVQVVAVVVVAASPWSYFAFLLLLVVISYRTELLYTTMRPLLLTCTSPPPLTHFSPKQY